MTLNRARKLLGKFGEQYSDEQVLALVKMVKGLSVACIDKIDNKIKTDGNGFLEVGKMQ